MAITVKHTKVSTIPDGDDSSLIRPSDWNDDHVLTGTIPVANGGTGAATLTGYVKGNGTAAMTAASTIPNTDITGLGTASTKDAGAALGVATLDASGKVPISELPAAVLGALSYQGTWNASTNNPTLTSSVGTKGYYYVVSVAGNTDLNGITDWLVGDWAVYNGTVWQKVDNTETVTSVNGQTGAVTITLAGLGGGTIATQNANAVAITGGTINGTTIGATTASTGAFTTVTASTSVTTPLVGNTDSGDLTIQAAEATLDLNYIAPYSLTPLVNVFNGDNVYYAPGQWYIPFPSDSGVQVGWSVSTSGSAVVSTVLIVNTNVSMNVAGSVVFGDQIVVGHGYAWGYNNFLITPTSSGNVLDVTINGTSKAHIANNGQLSVGAIVESTTGGFKFPDGTTQTTAATGTVTSVAATAGTGISITGSPITTSGTLNITNTAPDQVVVLTAGTGISTSGTYPNFTITNTSSSSGDVVGPASATDNAIARFDTTTGKLIQNSVVTVSDTGAIAGATTITDIDYIDFDTTYNTTLGAGQLGWNGNDTLGLGMIGGNVVQHIGEDTFFYVKASAAITKGQLCMFTGAVGSSGVLTAAPSNSIPFAEAIIGVAAEDIANNGFGLIQSTGTLKGVDTSAFLDGDILYYNSAVTGGFTKTFPASGPIVIVAAVAKSGSGGSGVLTIRVSFQTRVTAGTAMSVTQGNDVVTVTNTAPDQTVAIASGTGISVTGTYPNFTVTNTSPSSGGTVTSVTATSPVTSTGGTTPVIAMPAATGSVDGYLTSTDWTTFNGKQATLVSGTNLKTVSGTSLLGSGDVGTIGATYGGTSQSTYTTGDILYASASNTLSKLTVGSSGQVLTVASGVPSWASPAGGSAAGSNTQVQYNNSGAFGASASFTYAGSTLTAPIVSASNGLVVNSNTVSASYAIPSGSSASSVGPVSVAAGQSVTIPSGSRWVVL